MTDARRWQALALVVAVLAVVAALPAAGGGQNVPASTSPPATAPTALQADAPRFVDAPYSEHRGDVVRMTVALPNGSAANLTIVGNATDYAATISLHDGSGDGRVTLLWNTHTAGSGAPNATARAATPGDAATVRNASLVVDRINAGTYDLRVAAAGEQAATPADRSVLRLDDAGNATATVLTAPGRLFDDLTSRADVAAARRNGTLAGPPSVDLLDERAAGVLPRDVVVLEVRAPGVAGALAAARGPNVTARFRAGLGEALQLRLLEHEATVRREEVPSTVRVGDFAGRRVVADPANDTYFVVLDTGAPVAVETDHPTSLVDFRDEAYVVHVDTPPFTGPVRAPADDGTAQFLFYEPEPSFDVAGPSGPDGTVTVAGFADILPGTGVVVVLRGDAEALPVELRVRVDADRRFEAAFEVPSLPADASFVALVRRDGETVAKVPATSPSATVVFDNHVDRVQTLNSVHVDEVETTHGGFVVVRRRSVEGPIVGVSEYLPPGDRSVWVPLNATMDGSVDLVAVARRDVDTDATFDPGVDVRYPSHWAADNATYFDSDGAATPTATPSATATRTRTATRSLTATATPTTEATSTVSAGPTATPDAPVSGPIPGPGPLVAAVALLAAATVAARSATLAGGDDR